MALSDATSALQLTSPSLTLGRLAAERANVRRTGVVLTVMADVNQNGLKRSELAADVRRAVRQRCRFGCVVCGSAIVQYHHFDPPFAEATEHRSDGITLLCGGCHDKVTRGLWSDNFVRMSDASPYCVRASAHHVLDVAAPLRIVAGTVLFLGTGPLVQIDDQPALEIAVEDGRATLSARFLDERGLVLIEIVKNEILVRNEQWDATFIGRTLSIRRGPGDVAFECVVHPPN